MSISLAFAVVPFDTDGGIGELWHGDNMLTKGVIFLDTEYESDIPSELGLQLNVTGVDNVNFDTDGAFLNFLDGDEGQRYLMLGRRRDQIEELGQVIAQVTDPFRRQFLEILLYNTYINLSRYGDQAALLIY